MGPEDNAVAWCLRCGSRSSPELPRIEPEYFGDPVHVRLDGERHGRHTKPRIALVSTRFVKVKSVEPQVRDRVHRWWNACFVTPYGEKHAYAPTSCRVTVRRPRISRRSSPHRRLDVPGPRVDEARNSSSASSATSPAARLDREERADRLRRGLDLAAEAAADRTADELQPVQGTWRCAATTPIEKYIACVQE